MKKLVVFVLVGIILTSCSSEGKFKRMMDKHDNKLLTQALSLGDVPTAIAAVESLLAASESIRYADLVGSKE